MSQYQFPDLDNFTTQEVVDLVDDYYKFNSDENHFFYFHEIPILFKEIDALIKKSQFSNSLWIFFLNYLAVVSETMQGRDLPFFQFYDIQQFDVQNNKINLRNETDSIVQTLTVEESKKQIILVKLIKKYFLIILYHEVIYLVDYSKNNQEQMKMIVNQLTDGLDYEIRLIQKFINPEASPYYFYFLLSFLQGVKIDTIQLTEFEHKICHDRVVWLILSFGFDQIEKEFQEQIEIDQQNILKLKQNQALKELRKQRVAQLQPKKLNKVRLQTPKSKQEREQQINLLNERISYLKVLNGVGDDDDILTSEIFQIKMKKLNKDLETEFQNLDQIKQNQMLYSSSQNQLLKNASQILQGKFDSQLFQGLGLQLQTNSKVETLKQLQEQNYQSIVDPIMRQEGKKLPPGKFVTVQKDNLIAMKYGIKISRDALYDLRNGRVKSEIVDFYFKFLQEFSSLCNERQAFMQIADFDNLIFEQRTGKEAPQSRIENYLSNFDYIYFPIKQGQVDEYSLGVIDVQNLVIRHYYLCYQKPKLPVSSLQQIFRSWQIQEQDVIDEVQQRIDMQHRFLQFLIYWIRKQSYHYKMERISNMKLWKIKIEEIKTVSQPYETGMYLLCVITNFCLKKKKVDTFQNKDVIREILENVICSTGLQEKLNDRTAIEYFKKRIDAI
ncbi:unnamed protein product (macronuclear) [Paramecium tetraurelia]|uniref:Uncharacterized protein n=1 Tax=Paramecium tetraurelia TaxID=5888 RepID=A0EFR1_PARTE|nr:uncharacterized protein GSPATT00026475001 [Paramecium tetraurelia]CAK94152.1 unnamed protein product [Paramecium tetraurelia]|eukprot:XP_001461525.1 hypothetical protein (macronuclear) [Paramecium tetraurelia strain d4-2]